MDSFNNKGKRGENPCAHYKCNQYVYSGVDFCYSSSTYHDGREPWVSWACSTPESNWGWMASGSFDTRLGSTVDPTVGLPALYVNAGKEDVPIIPRDLNVLVDSSLRAMLPGIKPTASIVNSIYELKDFKSLPGTLQRAKNSSEYLIQRIRDKFKNVPASYYGEKTLRRLTRGTADGYLQWMFNIRPLVSDCKAVRACIQNVRSEVAELLAREGKMQKRFYKRYLTETWKDKYDSYSSGSPLPNGVDGSFLYERYVRHESPMFCAQLKYRYALDEWEREEALLRGMADALGVNLNPAILWNAIPWSFVVDWLFGVSRWLDQFKYRNIEPHTYIHGYTYSVHVKRKIETFMSSNSSPYTHSTVPVCSRDEEAYLRRPFAPNMIEALTTSGFDLTKVSLLLALGASRP